MSALTEAIAKDDAKLCSVAEAIRKLEEVDPDSASDFHAWMAREIRFTDHEVWSGLQRLGYRVGRQTVGRHRRQVGECGCTS